MFGKGKDPTADWPAAARPPAVDFEGRAFGPIRLGDPFTAARPLGRPQRVTGSPGGNQVLEYAEFELEFAAGRLVCVKFDIDAPDTVIVGSSLLSRATTPADARFRFGDPASDSDDAAAHRRWMDWVSDGATLGLEFDADGLTCIQLYAEGYA